MKKNIFTLLALLLLSFSLSACIKNQNTDNSTPVATSNPNATNYQEMLQEQSLRADEDRATLDAAGHGGGGRR